MTRLAIMRPLKRGGLRMANDSAQGFCHRKVATLRWQKPCAESFAMRRAPRFNGRMIAKRVIPCLDVHDGHVTRGIQFGVAEKGGLRNVGDPVELALRYNEQGADEMVFFDITATAHGRGTMVEVIERAADQCFMPLTVGGGIKSVEDMYAMLRAGADKISINSNALARPELIREGAEKFGSQCIVVSIDAKKIAPDKWGVFSHGDARTPASTPLNGPNAPWRSARARLC